MWTCKQRFIIYLRCNTFWIVYPNQILCVKLCLFSMELCGERSYMVIFYFHFFHVRPVDLSNPTNKTRNEKNLHLKFESSAPKIERPIIFLNQLLLSTRSRLSSVLLWGAEIPPGGTTLSVSSCRFPGEIISVFSAVAVYK